VTGPALAAVAVAALAAWILFPLLSRRPPAGPEPDDDRLGRLLETKHAVYRSILDLELDRSLGKVSEADYLVMRRQHEAEALAVLREMDEMAGAGSLEDVLEREIAEARERLRSRRG
jgi:hypothetical protein